MSERKSWDVVPNRAPKRDAAPTPRPAAAPQRRTAAPRRVDEMRPTRREAAPAPAATVVRKPRPATRPSGERLRDRRRKERKALRTTLLVLVAILFMGAAYALWMPMFRVTEVRAASDADQRVVDVTRSSLTGTYAHLLPHNSIFFFPKEQIRQAILDSYPDVEAVSIQRSSFHSITVATTPRAKAFIWCGTAIDTVYLDGCFDADAEGLIFRQSDQSLTGSSTQASSSNATGELRIFSPLDAPLGEGQTPVRRHVISATAIPDALRFVKAVRALGASVSSLVLRGDEADLWLNGPTRITYILGHEQEASQLAASTLSKLPLADGSVQYVDLRFTGKVYVKRYGN